MFYHRDQVDHTQYLNIRLNVVDLSVGLEMCLYDVAEDLTNKIKTKFKLCYFIKLKRKFDKKKFFFR